jgi:hypothetical protein
MMLVVTRTRTVITAFALASVLALGACSDDDPEPKFAPTPSTSAPTAESTSPVASMGPAEAFAAWVDARNEALTTGDTAGAEALSAATCETCRNSLDPIREIYEKGGHYETDGWTVVASRVISESDDSAKVSAGLKYAAGRTVPEAGAEPVTYEVERHIVQVKLTKEDGQWRVKFMGYLS